MEIIKRLTETLKYLKILIRIYPDQLIEAGTTSSHELPKFQTSRKPANPAFDQDLNLKTFQTCKSILRQSRHLKTKFCRLFYPIYDQIWTPK